jgi:branched-chain amino acid transport system ATP-binding protein
MNETLEIKDLVVDRGGREVLHGISMFLPQGEITALLGANGAGKSSLVMTIGGSVQARSGEILHNGASLIGLKPHMVRARGVCVVAEGHQVLYGLTVEDNLRAAAMMHPASEVNDEIAKVMAIFPELTERLNVNAENLSGGQKQMVNIAQALIARPRFLLIDELSFGLAPAIVSRLGNVIREVAAQGVGVLLIEQFTSLALAVSSRAYVMERGRLVFDGTSSELAANPGVLHGAYLAS